MKHIPKNDKYIPGASCTVNASGDLFMMVDARAFIGNPCRIIKRTRSGKILLCLIGKEQWTLSVGQRNVDLMDA